MFRGSSLDQSDEQQLFRQEETVDAEREMQDIFDDPRAGSQSFDLKTNVRPPSCTTSEESFKIYSSGNMDEAGSDGSRSTTPSLLPMRYSRDGLDELSSSRSQSSLLDQNCDSPSILRAKRMNERLENETLAGSSAMTKPDLLPAGRSELSDLDLINFGSHSGTVKGNMPDSQSIDSRTFALMEGASVGGFGVPKVKSTNTHTGDSISSSSATLVGDAAEEEPHVRFMEGKQLLSNCYVSFPIPDTWIRFYYGIIYSGCLRSQL